MNVLVIVIYVIDNIEEAIDRPCNRIFSFKYVKKAENLIKNQMWGKYLYSIISPLK